jgi:hypothetical protein
LRGGALDGARACIELASEDAVGHDRGVADLAGWRVAPMPELPAPGLVPEGERRL